MLEAHKLLSPDDHRHPRACCEEGLRQVLAGPGGVQGPIGANDLGRCYPTGDSEAGDADRGEDRVADLGVLAESWRAKNTASAGANCTTVSEAERCVESADNLKRGVGSRASMAKGMSAGAGVGEKSRQTVGHCNGQDLITILECIFEFL